MSRFGLAAAAALTVLACGPSQTAAPTPTPTPLAVLASRYTQLVAPANTALGAVVTALGAKGADMNTTRPAFQGYRDALVSLDAQLPKFQADVPASMRSDVQQLREGVATQLSDINGILSITTASDWLSTLGRWETDAKSFGGAAQLVRADLGLPPAGTPSLAG